MNPKQQADDPIKHVVLVMFENHSFDQMLGCFKEVYPDLEGVDPHHPHVNLDDRNRVFKQELTRERQMFLDPHHEVKHVQLQMEDNNGGFVKDLVASAKAEKKQVTDAELDEQCRFVMGYYPMGFLAALHRLAGEFLICDHWHASLPGPTWPNRFFALTGTSNGRVNMPGDGEHKLDLPGFVQQNQDTIFDLLTAAGISWKVYFHDIPQSFCLTHQRRAENVARYFPISEFHKDALGPATEFPAFSFIEPDYNGTTENDDHPPHDIMRAQKLLADVYNAIRSNNTLWNSTLLVVLYDEHGGFYDHVAAPTVEPPDDHHEEYDFKQLGLRVPALLVSPWVKRGFDPTLFDHTSLLTYLVHKWKLPGSLGNRMAAASSILPLIEKAGPRNDTISWIELTSDELRPPSLEREDQATAYLSAHHRAMSLIGRFLITWIDEDSPRILTWLARLVVSIKALFAGKKTSPEAILKEYEATKGRCQTFLARRKEQAKPKLAAIIKNLRNDEHVRRHAAEALGYVVNRRFHREIEPITAAQNWIRKEGY